jgi:hypothetical protein
MDPHPTNIQANMQNMTIFALLTFELKFYSETLIFNC